MNIDDAIAILNCNYSCSKNSLTHDLYEEETFSARYFWEYYDSVITLAKEALVCGKSIEIAMKITFIYQRILKEIIYHFDEADGSTLKHFPSNYAEYIERLDGALDAYFRGVFIEESVYSLAR